MKKCFSMIELIFAIIVIGILAAVAIPNMSTGLETSKEKVLETNIKVVQTQINSLKNSCQIRQKHGGSLNEVSFDSNCIPKQLTEVLSTMQLETQAKTDLISNTTYDATTGILKKK